MNSFSYRHKNVLDLPGRSGQLRLWSSEGPTDPDALTALFAPVFHAGDVYPYIALLPDFHEGDHALVGSVVPTIGSVLPELAGCDLGCGMFAQRLPFCAEDIVRNGRMILSRLLDAIPVGTSQHQQVSQATRQNPVWDFELMAPILCSRQLKRLQHQFGTLGGGNHFIELQAESDGQVWMVLHTGSRFLGALIREWYIDIAHKMNHGTVSRAMVRLPVDSAEAEAYLQDATTAVLFAKASRLAIAQRVLEVLEDIPGLNSTPGVSDSTGRIDVPHNTVTREIHFGQSLVVHRKGAQALEKGQRGLLPGSMGTSSYIVEGRGNAFSFRSCSHGAGRKLTRSDARRKISAARFERSMHGVIFPSDKDLIEEAPDAYKDVRKVLRSQRDLLKILHELRPLLVIKG